MNDLRLITGGFFMSNFWEYFLTIKENLTLKKLPGYSKSVINYVSLSNTLNLIAMRFAIGYVSTATPSLSKPEIQELLNSARSYNNLYGITGILMFSEGNFFQVLEGEKDIIQELFEKIKKDPRHYNLIQVINNPISEPSFSKYRSPFTIIMGGTDHTELYNFLKNEENNNPENYKSITYMASKFMNLS